jgi:hypothetical protein
MRIYAFLPKQIKRAMAEDVSECLYVVVYPGKFLTVAVVSTRFGDINEAGEAEINTQLLECVYEGSSYGERGTPDVSRMRRFGFNVLKRVQNAVVAKAMSITAVLVRTPPPPDVMGAKNADFLQCNTWLEGFVVGLLFSAFPNVPTWYVHPNAVRATFFANADGTLRGMGSREMEEASTLAMSSHMCRVQIDHEKTAACVLVAAHQFVKFCGMPLTDAAPAPPPPPPAPVKEQPRAQPAAAGVWKQQRIPDSVTKGSGERHEFVAIPVAPVKQKKKKAPKAVVVSEPADE